MATYKELHDLKDDSDLLDVVETCCTVAAEGIATDVSPPANQAQRLKWAEQTFSGPRSMAIRVFPAVLAANKEASVAAIQGATDAAFQSNVDSVVDLFADLIP